MERHSPSLLVPLLALLAAASAPGAPVFAYQETSAAPVSEDVRERVAVRAQEVLDALVARGISGVSAALILPDGSELAVAAGVASREDQRALTPEDRMLSGSVGKTYVTAAAHHLIAAGELDLDARAAEYFEDSDAEWLERLPNAREVTLRQLLRHQTGIPRYVFGPEFEHDLMADANRVFRPEELLSYVFDTEPMFAPGEGWAYADTNYIVVGMVIEKVTGGTFYDYVQEHFIQPHELADTIPSNSRDIPGIVQGHVVMGRQMGVPERTLDEGRFVFNPQFEWCGGGWANTPLDLARWAHILYGGEAFDGPYLDTLLDAVDSPQLGPGARYGLGAMLRESPAGASIGHDGFMPGYLTTMAIFPEARIAGAIQANTDDMRAFGRPLFRVLDELVAIAREELGT